MLQSICDRCFNRWFNPPCRVRMAGLFAGMGDGLLRGILRPACKRYPEPEGRKEQQVSCPLRSVLFGQLLAAALET
jgi:hypothetical protein